LTCCSSFVVAALTLSASSEELSSVKVDKGLLPTTTVSALKKVVAAVLKLSPGTDFVLGYRDAPVSWGGVRACAQHLAVRSF
jgi:hypothetical protein